MLQRSMGATEARADCGDDLAPACNRPVPMRLVVPHTCPMAASLAVQRMSAERALLQRLQAGPASGARLAEECGQSRAAVWKRIQALREAGVAIDAHAGRGYALAQPLDLLDADAIRAVLPAAACAQVAALDVAWSTDSTNSQLLQQATPAAGVAVLLAERQTGGRGRRGRSWASPLAANLYLSLARRFDGGLARLGGLSLVAGIAVADELRALGVAGIGLKWPNDIVVRDGNGLRKLGGILVEGGGEHAGPVRAVIGLGLNVRMPASFVAGIGQPWIDLAGATADSLPSRNALAAIMIGKLIEVLVLFDREGLVPFLPHYAALDALAGRTVVVHGGDGDHAGTALGIASDGALRVQLADGVRNFHAGEVSVRPA